MKIWGVGKAERDKMVLKPRKGGGAERMNLAETDVALRVCNPAKHGFCGISHRRGKSRA